jgi:hypothetical protein
MLFHGAEVDVRQPGRGTMQASSRFRLLDSAIVIVLLAIAGALLL